MKRSDFLFSLPAAGWLAGPGLHARSIDNTPSREELLSIWSASEEFCRKTGEAMPEAEYSYRPTGTEIYTFGQQLQHIAQNHHNLISGYLSDREPPEWQPVGEQASRKSAVLYNLDSIYAYGAETIERLTDEDLTQTVDFFARPLPRWHVLFVAQDHATHHCGQAIIYLRMNGIEPPDWRKW